MRPPQQRRGLRLLPGPLRPRVFSPAGRGVVPGLVQRAALRVELRLFLSRRYRPNRHRFPLLARLPHRPERGKSRRRLQRRITGAVRCAGRRLPGRRQN